VKVNALPKQAWVVINHRISMESCITETEAHDMVVLKSLASKFNLTYTTFGKNIVNHGDCGTYAFLAYGTLTLSEAFEKGGLEPALTTPFKGDDVMPYQILSGSIKMAFNRHRNIEGDDDAIVMSPGIMPGNTGMCILFLASHYTLAYGGNPWADGDSLLKKAMLIDNFVEIIRFIMTLIMNMDESVLS
ncbi:hypothetical protein BKA83DRAFT_4060603, partial [Pisolithus microcarpus]